MSYGDSFFARSAGTESSLDYSGEPSSAAPQAPSAPSAPEPVPAAAPGYSANGVEPGEYPGHPDPYPVAEYPSPYDASGYPQAYPASGYPEAYPASGNPASGYPEAYPASGYPSAFPADSYSASWPEGGYQNPYPGYPAGGYPGSYFMGPQPHPQATTVLILGILSIFFTITAPFAWYYGHKARREIQQNPGLYASSASLTTGWVIGIIVTVANVLFWLLIIVAAVFGESQ